MSYIKNLQLNLFNILLPIFGRDITISYLGADQMKIWKLAFIDYSYNSEKNNSEMSHYGESIIKTLIGIFLYEQYPKFSVGDLTEINRLYNSKENQVNYAKMLNLHNFLLVGEKNINFDDALEHCFRSFFSALELIGKESYSFSNCLKLFVSLYGPSLRSINPNESLKAHKTSVQQILSMLKIPGTIKVWEETFINSVFTISISKDLLTKIRSFGFNLKSNILGSYKNFDKIIAEKKAYEIADKNFKEAGLFFDHVKKFKEMMYLKNISGDFYDLVEEKMKNMNIQELYFKRTNETQAGGLIQLEITFKNSEKIIPILSLNATDKRNDYRTAKELLIMEFIKRDFENLYCN